MPPRPVRRFTLIDAMILVAAAALGMAGVRAETTPHLHPLHLYGRRPLGSGHGSSSPGSGPISISAGVLRSFPSVGNVGWPIGTADWFSAAQGWAESASLLTPWLAALSLAMLAIRLRRPRPPWPRLIREPGSLASLVATIALMVRLLLGLLRLLLAAVTVQGQIISRNLGPDLSHWGWLACQATQPSSIGLVVLTAWLALATGGCWGQAWDWVDRVGVAVGSGWIVLLMVDWFRTLAA